MAPVGVEPTSRPKPTSLQLDFIHLVISSLSFICRSRIYGDTFAIFIMHRVIVISNSPVVLKTVLVNADQKDFPKSPWLSIRFLFGER